MTDNITADDLREDEIELIHYLDKKVRVNGGRYDTGDAVFEIGETDLANHFTSNMIHEVLKGERNGPSGTDLSKLFTIEKGSDGGDLEYLTEVETVGDVPEAVKMEFSHLNSVSIDSMEYPFLEDLENSDKIKDKFEYLLGQEDIKSIRDLADADPEKIKDVLDNAFKQVAPEIEELNDGVPITDSDIDALENQGIETAYDILEKDTDEIQENDERDGVTINEGKIAMAKQQARSFTRTASESDAEQVVDKARLEQPIGPELAEKELANHKDRVDKIGEESAIVRSVKDDKEDDKVGQPLAEVRDDLSYDDPEAVYMADMNINANDPVNTGLPVLEPQPEYDAIPKLETETSGGGIPATEDGEPVKPAIPLEEMRQVPMDELVAKSLADGITVCIEGERGTGKNMLIEYICYKTNRGYRSFDASKNLTETKLFGPITTDEDGLMKPRSGPLKQGLLNGDVIVINEYSAMNQGVGMALHQLLERGNILIPAHGEWVKPHPATKIVVTKNPPTIEYRGNNELNQATRGRFRYFWQQYPDTKRDEVESLNQQVNKDRTYVRKETIENVVEFARRTRKEDNNNWPTLSTRDCKDILDEVKIGLPAKGAVKAKMKKRKTQTQSLESAYNTLNTMM